MDKATILSSQLLSAKQRMEDTGGASQVVGYYISTLFSPTTPKLFKHTNLNTVTLPAEVCRLYVIRLGTNGLKLKPEVFDIGYLFKTLQPFHDKYYLQYKIKKGKSKSINVTNNFISVEADLIKTVVNKKLIESLNDTLPSIGNSSMRMTNSDVLTVDNVGQI
jgi:hypothetical protein